MKIPPANSPKKDSPSQTKKPTMKIKGITITVEELKTAVHEFLLKKGINVKIDEIEKHAYKEQYDIETIEDEPELELGETEQ